MKKSELLNIPMPDVQITPFSGKNTKSKPYDVPYSVLARCVPGSFGEVNDYKPSGLLVLWLFPRGERLEYTVFVCRGSASWMSYSHFTKKWYSGMLRSLTGYNGYSAQNFRYADAASATLGSYFESGDVDTLRSLDEFQQNIREYTTKMQIRRSRVEIDALMEQVTPLPSDSGRYINNHVLPDSRYVWYEKIGKRLVGVCTHCGHLIDTVDFPRGQLIDTKWKCPLCRSPVTFKALNRSADVHDSEYFAVLQPVRDGLLERVFKVSRVYKRESIAHAVNMLESGLTAMPPDELYFENLYECFRTHLKANGSFLHYEHTARNNLLYGGKNMWYLAEKDRYGHNITGYTALLYPYNVRALIKETPLRYTGLYEFARGDTEFRLTDYLRKAVYSPVMEKCAKLGLFRMAKSFTEGDYSCHDFVVTSNAPLDSVFGVNKADLRMLAKLDASVDELLLLKGLRKLGRRAELKDFRELRKAHIGGMLDCDKHFNLLSRVSLHRIAKYVSAQSGLCRYALDDWTDYLEDCRKLGLDLSSDAVLFPRDLAQAHERTLTQVRHLSCTEKDTMIQKRCQALEPFYNLERDGFLIRMAHDGNELIYEGKHQNICVGGYIDKYAGGDCTILFIRKADEPDKPFVTVEVRERFDCVDEIQIRAYRNAPPDDATAKWWRAYRRDVLDKLGGAPYEAEHNIIKVAI